MQKVDFAMELAFKIKNAFKPLIINYSLHIHKIA